MTQPNTVDMTFDTSLVDVKPFANANTSFSTTESDSTSDVSPSHPASGIATTSTSSTMMPPPKPSAPVQHIPTQLAYNQWAEVYDTDGNMLQAIDGLELSILLPKFLAQVKSSTAPPEISVLDLGCGTGRNTAKLLTYPWPARTPIRITGLDFSSAMLDIAAKKLSSVANDSAKERVLQLECCDCFPTASNRSASPFPAVTGLKQQDAIISTLVLEHIPLSSFFATLSSLLVPSSLALLTNMHADMGQRSQAGFVNADGVKVRGESYIYTVEETVQAAQEAGFEVVDVREREVRRADMEGGFVGKRGWKWVGIKVWFAVVLRKGA